MQQRHVDQAARNKYEDCGKKDGNPELLEGDHEASWERHCGGTEVALSYGDFWGATRRALRPNDGGGNVNFTVS
jgi:hypothetical protein